jgi:two-component system OmpR family response regulator
MSATLTTHSSPARESAKLARLDILIAEDNTDGAESLAHILERAGYSVRVVFDGQAAVAAALIDPPDVILMDIGLPRMDGWEAARRIVLGLNNRRCFLVALTGYDRPEDRRRSREAGFHMHLAKPVDPEELLEILGHYRPSAHKAS